MKKMIIVMVLIVMVMGVSSTTNAQVPNYMAEQEVVAAALNVLPSQYRVPADKIRLVLVEGVFADQSAEWRKFANRQAAFTIPGRPWVYINLKVRRSDAEKDPLTNAVMWWKAGMKVCPNTYVLASFLAHEYYAHGVGNSKGPDPDEEAARLLEKQVMTWFIENGKLNGMDEKPFQFQSKSYLRYLDDLIAEARREKALASRR